jgi:hypothetical protein
MLPTDALIKFIVCETARQEKDDKVSLLGLYPDDRILLAADARFPAAFPLSLVYFLLDGTGPFIGKLEIKMPGPHIQFLGEMPKIEKATDRPATILASFMPFVASTFGKYQAILTLDKQAYVREFEVAPKPA